MERVLIEYTANVLWQLPLLAAGAWLLLWAIRPRPLAQHRLWLAVLGLALLLPLHGMGKNGISAMQGQHSDLSTQARPTQYAEPNRALLVNHTWRSAEKPGLELLLPRMRSVRLSAPVEHWLVALYLLTVVFGWFRIVRSWRAARRLVEHSAEATVPRQNIEAFEGYGRKLRINLPQLRESDEVLSPMIVGVMAPVLLLPHQFASHSEDEITAALCHELAHIARRDYLVNLICRIAALPVAWHPVTYGVQQRIRRTREMVCDAMAGREMQSEMRYAKCLLALAQSMVGDSGMKQQAQVLGLFSNDVLEERVMRLTETKTALSVRTKVARVASGAMAMIAAIAMTAMFHVAPTMAAAQAPIPPAVSAQNMPSVPETQPAVSQGEPATPPLAIAHGKSATVVKGKGDYIHRWKGADGEPFVIVNRERPEPTPEEQRRIENDFKRQMKDVQRQVAEATAKLNSPEFNQQMREAARQVAEATAKLDSPEFKQQMDDLKKQLRSGELQRSIKEATAELDNPEFKQQMSDLKKQLQSEEFQRRMKEASRRLKDGETQLGHPQAK